MGTLESNVYERAPDWMVKPGDPHRTFLRFLLFASSIAVPVITILTAVIAVS